MPNVITSTQAYYQDQLSRDEKFRKRLQQHLINHALTVMAEANTVPNHAERVLLARNIISDGAESYVNRMAFVVVNHANLNASISIIDGNVTTSVTDANLLAAVNAMWNILSGIGT